MPCRGKFRSPWNAHGNGEIALALWDAPAAQPGKPEVPDRDRFCCPTATAQCCCTLLHLTGYDLPMDELKRFRSCIRRPRSPELGVTPGVETTTVLGAGTGKRGRHGDRRTHPRREFKPPGLDIVDHRTYVSVGDGCLMEESRTRPARSPEHSLWAKLIALYDDNNISIDAR